MHRLSRTWTWESSLTQRWVVLNSRQRQVFQALWGTDALKVFPDTLFHIHRATKQEKVESLKIKSTARIRKTVNWPCERTVKTSRRCMINSWEVLAVLVLHQEEFFPRVQDQWNHMSKVLVPQVAFSATKVMTGTQLQGSEISNQPHSSTILQSINRFEIVASSEISTVSQLASCISKPSYRSTRVKLAIP